MDQTVSQRIRDGQDVDEKGSSSSKSETVTAEGPTLDRKSSTVTFAAGGPEERLFTDEESGGNSGKEKGNVRFGGASSSRSLPLRRGGGDKESQPRRTVKQILQRMGPRRVSTTKNNSSSKLRASQTSRTSTLSSALQPTGSSGALTALPRMETIPSDSTRETERESGLSELTERELSDLQSFRSGPSERSMDSAALERGATAAEEDGGGRLRFEEDEDDEDELEDDVELFPRFPDPQDGTVDRIREWVDRRAVQIETAKLKQQINMLRTGMLRPLVPSDKGYLD